MPSTKGESKVAHEVLSPSASSETHDSRPRWKCPDFVGFLAISFEDSPTELGLHPVLANSSPDLEDASMGGFSFDVRKVRVTSFPHSLNDELFKDREFVVVKHPHPDAQKPQDLYFEIGTELQILKHPPLRKHNNIIDFLAVVYYDAGEVGNSNILPALVIEYAELGSVKSYQENGYGCSVDDKIDIVTDAARGIQALHESGIIHGDLKTSNLLVCKHPSRKFIVKLTDFGFSFPVDDVFHVGHTKYLEAPEASGLFDKRYLIQSDIYSYGLLIHTVFQNGKAFYESIPEEDREANVMKLKVTGLLASIAQINLLTSMKKEKFHLLLFCKILAYALQPNPRNRFASLGKILLLLQLTNPIKSSDNQEMQQVQLPVENYQELRRNFSIFMIQYAEKYFSSLASLQIPMLGILKEEILERINIATSIAYGDWPVGATHVDFVPATSIHMFQDSIGLLPEDELAGDDLKPISYLSKLILRTDFMPSFPKISGVLSKAHPEVQRSAMKGLEVICTERKNEIRAAEAKLNLASVYANGVGIEHDLEKASSLVVEAAETGLVAAQKLYLDVFSKMAQTKIVNSELLSKCMASQDKEKKFMPLTDFKDVSAAEWSEEQRAYAMEECLKRGIVPCEDIKSIETTNCVPWCQLSFAILNNHLELATSLLHSTPTLLRQVFAGQETPLLLACSSGHIRIVELFLQKGGDPTIGNSDGVTLLHWLVAFNAKDKQRLLDLCGNHNVDFNAKAVITGRVTYKTNFVGIPLSGTPLHWAVATNDIAAINILLARGSDPTFRQLLEGDTWNLSPFELACRLSHAESVQRLLQEPEVRTIVNSPRLLLPNSSILVRPLFHTLSGDERWERLIRNGVNFKNETMETIRLLTEHGVTTDAVLEVGPLKMSAAFATAYHQCNADIMQAGLNYGFEKEIDSTFGGASSGGSALFLAITHGDREMFKSLLEHGANISVSDQYGFTPLQRAAKERDDIYFAEKLIEAGSSVDPVDPTKISAFYVGVYAGNFKVARYLYDRGADRDRMVQGSPMTILGSMISKHTRSSVRRVEFLLGLPDRGSDGFIAMKYQEKVFSAYHFAVPDIGENPDDAEITRIMVFLLLEKYCEPKYLNSTDGSHHDTVIGMATEVGNYKVVQALLKAGADPNIEDEYGRTALDKLYWRYCYPSLTEALKEIEISDKSLVNRTLRYVNHNTSETLSLLKSYNAKPNVFHFPGWFEGDSGYRSLEWVLERLKENRSPEARAKAEELMNSRVPVWGDLPIRVPERPMQFSGDKADASELEKSEGQSTAEEAVSAGEREKEGCS
ncbi:hypothetical protein BGZ60DRAFT_373143 [Tricladium varicosporioides]|nr:hypothetical protein BGZ60DRAFT_373143 [Hymenoscyphus varicosporioides]